ncbi:MAG TPA: HEAT repeat domain-containing protein [Gemmatimonadaceae bacterium]|nr:HEAT repeat domain-containing protein [Gemmatimonadaceae bacterium]
MRRFARFLPVIFALRVGAQTPKRPPLDSAAIADIATLLMLEDTRAFDAPELTRLLASAHPEVRRRAMLSVARLRDARGVELLRAVPLDRDTALAATRVFAVGQLHDSLTIPWFDSLLANSRTPRTVLTEAACALGKIKTAAAREALARFLTRATAGPRSSDAIGEALLSIGRSTARGDIAPIMKWTTSADEEIRWRATWGLFRPRDPAAVPALLTLARDRSPLVRSWAVRALTKPQADSASVGDRAERALIAALGDSDRRVRTEAIRALATFNDSAAVARLAGALDSRDSWISVSAAEGLARARAAWTIPRLLDAARNPRSCALRATAMRTLNVFANAEARAAATDMANDSVSYCRNAAAQLLRDTIPNAGRGGGRGPRPRATIAARPMNEYRAIVETWVVPAYMGQPLPRARWETPRGAIEIELYAGDAPLATDALERITNAGTMVGTEFTRVVPDFVDQQETIRDAAVQRDEVNRHRLTRGNLAWASAGLDTGRPGYTLNHTPQPHNEGDFTSLGRVVAGQDVVDRIELGDRIVSARIRRP